MKKLVFSSILGLIASASTAETIFLYEDTDDLPPPYWQHWSATPADSAYLDGRIWEVYIRGEGKRGNFYGVLEVNCPEPKHSNWLVSGGFLDPEDVPAQAIRNLRAAICKNGEDA